MGPSGHWKLSLPARFPGGQTGHGLLLPVLSPCTPNSVLCPHHPVQFTGILYICASGSSPT